MITHLSIKRATALALTLGAVMAGPAAAMPNQASGPAPVTSAPSLPQTAGPLGGGAELTPGLAYAYGQYLAAVGSRGSYGFTPHPRTVTGAHSNSGFEWGDAGIGAAGGLALSLLGLGAVAATRRRPHHAAGGLAQPAAR